MRTSENYRLQRSVKRLDLITEGLEETAPTPFPLTKEGVLEYLFEELFYDQELYRYNATITEVIVAEQVRGFQIVVETIMDHSNLLSWKDSPPYESGGTKFLVDLNGKVIEENDLSCSPITKGEYDLAYEEVFERGDYVVTIR